MVEAAAAVAHMMMAKAKNQARMLTMRGMVKLWLMW